MERMVIKENKDNNLKYINNIGRDGSPIQYISSEDPLFKDLPITEDASKKEEQLEYFTE